MSEKDKAGAAPHVERFANEERGEVNLVVEDRNYTLRLSNQAICEVQGRTGRTWGQLLKSMDTLDYVSHRDVVATLLKAYHGKEFPTLLQVSALIDEATMPVVNLAVAHLFELNAAQAQRVEAEDQRKTRAGEAQPENPTEATTSIGEPRISELVGLV